MPTTPAIIEPRNPNRTQHWRLKAECLTRNIAPDSYDSDTELPPVDAYMACEECPVRKMCLQASVATGVVEHGYWGGYTYPERLRWFEATQHNQRPSRFQQRRAQAAQERAAEVAMKGQEELDFTSLAA